MPTDFDGPLAFDAETPDDFGFDALRFDLLSLSPVPGYVVVADAEGRPIWVAPGAIASIGAQGLVGPVGPPGMQGPQGDWGLQGPPGRDGTSGSSGAPGATGAQGNQGQPGDPGPEGLQGIRGAPGETGATGATGTTGATGPRGIPGDQVPGPPAVANAANDEFNDDTGMSGPVNLLSAIWTWRNQGLATTTFPDTGGMRINTPASATSSHRILEQAVAAGDFSFETKVALNARATNFANVGIIAIDRTNGDFYKFGIEAASTATGAGIYIVRQTWTNATTFASASTVRTYGSNVIHLRIRRISSAFWFDYSGNGLDWINFDSALADIGINGIGIAANNENSLPDQWGTFYYFRRSS